MLTNEQALAWMYKGLRDVMSSFPTYIGDFFDKLPDGYEGIYEIIKQADQAAALLLIEEE